VRSDLRLTLAGAALALLLAGEVPARAADAAAGRVLAERLCANCHVVAVDATRGTTDAPTFPAIAARDGDISGPWLAFRLLLPHPQMPQVSLNRTEAADLAAYFAALKR